MLDKIFVREKTRDWYNRPRVWVEIEGRKMINGPYKFTRQDSTTFVNCGIVQHEIEPDLTFYASDPEHLADTLNLLCSVIARGKFLARLREANLKRLPLFGHGDLTDKHAWGPMQWGCAIAGEVGELCNVLKKFERQMPGDPSQQELYGEICDEIADVVIYLDLLCAFFEIDLESIVIDKFNSVSNRHGFEVML